MRYSIRRMLREVTRPSSSPMHRSRLFYITQIPVLSTNVYMPPDLDSVPYCRYGKSIVNPWRRNLDVDTNLDDSLYLRMKLTNFCNQYKSTEHDNNRMKQYSKYHLSEGNDMSQEIVYKEANNIEFVLELEYRQISNCPSQQRVWLTYENISPTAAPVMESTVRQQFIDAGFEVQIDVASSYKLITSRQKDNADEFGETVLVAKDNSGYVLLCSIMVGYNDVTRVVFLSKKSDNMNKIISDLSKKFDTLYGEHKVKVKTRPCFNIIVQDSDGLGIREFDVAELGSLEGFIENNYNDDFKPVNDLIVTKLKESNKGITLLHGTPGTGKTNYIRYLANMVTDKRLIYIPPEMTNVLASPQFIGFVMDNDKSIFIVEDAENVLMTREAGASSAVTNILNMSDGIIGDAVQCQFVCTFNCDYTEIDSALKRKGRLNAAYNFGALTRDKAQTLINKLYGFNGDDTPKYVASDNMTLAQIYNLKEEDFSGVVNVKKNAIGFR